MQPRMLDAEKLPIPTHYVWEHYLGEENYEEPRQMASEEWWMPTATRDPGEMAEALAVVMELYHSNHESRLRTWVETRIR
ncbi:MAG: hypothetical protein Q8R28_15225 [Dehalococcoidia bacterium]|nr:hypothetical protein [Dehalococcoidia bacterium]